MKLILFKGTLETNKKCIISKWKEKREVLFLTTKEIPKMIEVVNKRGDITNKPSTILEYNDAKAFIDLSDKLASYSTTLRKSFKRYRKVAFELFTNTTVVNAFQVNNIIQGKSKMSDIVEFREKLAHIR